jgi:hypothetical protein
LGKSLATKINESLLQLAVPGSNTTSYHVFNFDAREWLRRPRPYLKGLGSNPASLLFNVELAECNPGLKPGAFGYEGERAGNDSA